MRAFFKLSEQIIVKLVKYGEIPSFRTGEHYRIKKSDVGHFIDELVRVIPVKVIVSQD